MKQHAAPDNKRVLAAVVAAFCLLVGRPAHAQPAKSSATCAHRPLTLSSWTIPQSRPSLGWWPLAVSGERVVMVHERTYQPVGPEPITMALAVAGSPQFRPIKPGAYPPFGVLQRWQRYRYHALSSGSVIELVVRDGLVAWDGGMADLVGGGSTSLPMRAIQLSGGHALVLQRNPLEPYILRQVLHRCST